MNLGLIFARIKLKARKFLEELRKYPCITNSTKEAFCAIIVTALTMDDIEILTNGDMCAGNNFYAKHIGREGPCLVGGNDSFDDEWAFKVIDDALSFVDKKENVNGNAQVRI